MAIFYEGDKKIKTLHFGAIGYSDYTIHHDEARRQRYIDRHRKSEDWNNPMTAGTLSLYILFITVDKKNEYLLALPLATTAFIPRL